MAKVIVLKKQDGRLLFDVEPAYIFSTLANGNYTITVKKAKE